MQSLKDKGENPSGKASEAQPGDSLPPDILEIDKKAKAKAKAKKKKIITAVSALVIAVLAGFVVLRFAKKPKNDMGTTTYTDVTAERRDLTVTLSGSGTIQPADSYTVTSLVEGEILSDYFEEGDTVTKDTVLYEIDSSDASSNLEKAQMSYSQAERMYENMLEALSDLTVKASNDGIITEIAVEEGDSVMAGQTVASYRNSGTMVLKLPFTSDDAQNIYVGNQASVTLDGSFETLYGTVTKVSKVDNVLTGNMMTRDVTIEVSNPGALGTMQSATATVGSYACASSGTFSYKKEGVITAKQSGEVASINVKEGDAVHDGSIILTLKSDNLDDEIENSRVSLRNAELSYESQLDILDNYTITSPIDGTVIETYVKTGDNINSPGSTLCVIYDLSYMEIVLNIDELDIGKVKTGQKVEIKAEAAGDKVYEGEITKVSIQGTTAGGITVYPATIRIDETDGLLPGMNADIEIVVESAEDVLTVPVSAVQRNGTVLVKGEGESAPGTEAPEGYYYKEIKTGMTTDDYVEVLDGLNEGDTVALVRTTSSIYNMFGFGMGNSMEDGEEGREMGPPSGEGFPGGGDRPGAQGGMPR